MREAVSNYCEKLGEDLLLVQGPGGNVSWKEDRILWVKASGTWLANAGKEDIFVPVDLGQVRGAIAEGDFAVTPKVAGEHRLRPSIETILHALMPHKLVVHLHAVEIMAVLVRAEVKRELHQKLADSTISWISVPYRKPGTELAEAIADALMVELDAQVVFMENHGVVIGGETIEEVDTILQELRQRFHQPVSNFSEILKPSRQFPDYAPLNDPELNRLATIPELYGRLKQDWALYPDHVVFLGAMPVCVGQNEVLPPDNPPLLFFKEGEGIWVSDTFGKVHHLQLRCYYEVLIRQPFGNRLHSLSPEQIYELQSWDAEIYRKQMVK